MRELSSLIFIRKEIVRMEGSEAVEVVWSCLLLPHKAHGHTQVEPDKGRRLWRLFGHVKSFTIDSMMGFLVDHHHIYHIVACHPVRAISNVLDW